MQKNKLLKNTFLLVLGGFFVKILAFIIKILYTRYLNEDGVALITLIYPSYILLITISSFSLPVIVSKFVAENKYRKSKILLNSLLITLILNIIIISLFIILSRYFAIYILHERKCAILIKILCLSLPFISITSLIKGYFFGIENIFPIITANVLEEIIKLILIIKLLSNHIIKSYISGPILYTLIILICEISSFIILFIFLPKKINYKKIKYFPDKKCMSDLTKYALPTLSSRLIGTIGYFFEPIILTNLLLFKNLSINYIKLNYGYYQGYVITILTIPSFILTAFSSNLIPVITRNKNQKKKTLDILKKSLLLILIGSLIFLIILYIFGKKLMVILFKTTSGFNYLILLAPFFIIYYLSSPIYTTLQSLDQEKKLFKTTLISNIFKYFSLSILILIGFKFYSLIYAEIISILINFILNIYYLNRHYLSSSQ